MARITSTDGERVVPNRFELVLLAAARPVLCPAEKGRASPPGRQADSDGVREIAAGALDPKRLRRRLLEAWKDDVGKEGVPDGSFGIA